MLISITEYAARNGRNPATIRQRILRGTLPAVKIGRDWLIEEDTPLTDTRIKSGQYKDWRNRSNTPAE